MKGNNKIENEVKWERVGCVINIFKYSFKKKCGENY